MMFPRERCVGLIARQKHRAKDRQMKARIVGRFIMMVPFVVGLALAQMPAFEVASIRPASPPTPEAMRSGQFHGGAKIDGTRLDFGYVSLWELLPYSYRAKEYQLARPVGSGGGRAEGRGIDRRRFQNLGRQFSGLRFWRPPARRHGDLGANHGAAQLRPALGICAAADVGVRRCTHDVSGQAGGGRDQA